MIPYALDFETKIKSEVHGSHAKFPENDFVTVICGTSPGNIKVFHKQEGYKREVIDFPHIMHEDALIVGHNLSFDIAYVIEHFKKIKRIPQCWDTSVAQFLLTGQRHNYSSLAELQELYLGEVTKEDRIKKLYKAGHGADEIIAAKDRCPRLWALYNKYCYQDGSTVLQIFKKQYEIAKQRKMLPLIKMYNKFMVALVMMSSNGIKIDIPRIEKTINEYKLKSLELLEEAAALIKPYWSEEHLPQFKVLSPAHKSALLFGGYIKCKYKIEDGLYKNGNKKFKVIEENVFVKGFNLPSKYQHQSKIDGRFITDTNVINEIYKTSDNEIAKKYCALQIKAMFYDKRISTYLQPFLRYAIEGRIYPNFNNVAVITGRLSSSGPNIQNIPSKGLEWEKIQGQLIAPEGYICVSIDYSQLEMYIAAWNSGDEQLISDLQSGLDFHCQSLAFARQMDYNIVWKKCHEEEDPDFCLARTKAKAITFQKEYGAGIKKVAETTGLDVEVVKQVFEALDEKYWRLKLFKDYVLQTAENNKRISNIKYLPGAQRKGGKNGRRFNIFGHELLPVEHNNVRTFHTDLIREVGYFQTKYGKLYSFEEYATLDRDGRLRRGLSVPQTKNYTSQGGAADVVAACSVEVMEYCLKHGAEVCYISQIHDSFWLYVKEDKTDHINNVMAIMEDVPYALKKHLDVDLKFKFKVETKVGKNFADMTKWERKC